MPDSATRLQSIDTALEHESEGTFGKENWALREVLVAIRDACRTPDDSTPPGIPNPPAEPRRD